MQGRPVTNDSLHVALALSQASNPEPFCSLGFESKSTIAPPPPPPRSRGDLSLQHKPSIPQRLRTLRGTRRKMPEERRMEARSRQLISPQRVSSASANAMV